jgi:hypothetical protein
MVKSFSPCANTQAIYESKFSGLCIFFDYKQEDFMSDFTVTDQAVEKLKEYLEQNNISSALRIALMQGG